MDAATFQTIPDDERVEVTHTRQDLTLRATVAGSLREVGLGLLRGIADVDHAQLLDGAAIWVGFTLFWLRQVGTGEFVVEGPDFSRPDAFVTEHTADLTTHMWTSARQFDVSRGTGHGEEPAPIDSDVVVQRSVLTMLEQGGSGSFVMQRHKLSAEQSTKPDGTRRTGWQLIVPGPVEGEQAEMISVYVGSLIGLMPETAPFLAMPQHTMLQFEGTRLTGAWLLDPERLAGLATSHPGVGMGDAIFGGLVADPVLSELFVAGDLAQVAEQRRPAPDQSDDVIDVAAATLELPRDQVMAHADVIPELQLLRFSNPETRKALVVGAQGGLLLGDDTPVLLSEFLRGGRMKLS